MKAIATRSFDHNHKVRKGEDVSDTFDEQTLQALKRSGLVTLTKATKGSKKGTALPTPPPLKA